MTVTCCIDDKYTQGVYTYISCSLIVTTFLKRSGWGISPCPAEFYISSWWFILSFRALSHESLLVFAHPYFWCLHLCLNHAVYSGMCVGACNFFTSLIDNLHVGRIWCWANFMWIADMRFIHVVCHVALLQTMGVENVAVYVYGAI